jgi:uncharacterized delta-60 repeat protein
LHDAVLSCVEPLEFRRLLSGTAVTLDVGGDPAADPDTTAPTTSIWVGNVTSGGGSTHSVTVVYDDASGINNGTIDTGDISVERGGSTLNVISVDVSGDTGTARTAMYTFEALGGSWDSGDNGAYTVTVNTNAVLDASAEANGNAGNATNFVVDVAPPLSEIRAGTLRDAGSTTTVTVVYNADVAVDRSTIDTGDIDVRLAGALNVTAANITDVSSGGRAVTVVYTIQGPGGAWDSGDNGEYAVSLNPGAVRDANGTALDAAPTFLGVDIEPPAPVDNTKPTVSIAPIGDVTGAGGSSMTVVVTYGDDTLVDADDVGTGDIAVSKNGPGGNLNVTGVSTQVSGDGKTVIATYTVAAPGGSFDSADNGTYTVRVQDDAVRDAAGNGNDDASASFAINIDAPPPPPPPSQDTTAPTASVNAGNVDAAGGSSHAITVTYQDDVGIDVGTVGTGDLTVSGPGGNLSVTGVSTQVSGGGKTVVATYTLAAPGGSFDSADNGGYTVTLNAGAVSDTSGNGVGSASDPFTVDVPAPPPPDDAGPVAAISAPNIGTPGAGTHTITVVYTDEGRIRANTIGTDDLIVSLNGGAPLNVVDVQTSSADGGRKITATYVVAAPGGSWDVADNGTYSVAIAAGAVADTQGNGSAAAAGSFTVNASVQDDAAPSGGIVTGNVTTAGVTKQLVTVGYADDTGIDFSTIGTDDVKVTGPAGELAVNVVDIAQAADGTGATVTYTFAAPAGGFTSAHNGTYTVTLAADSVRDAAGKGVAAASATFQVAVPEPTPIDPGFGNGNAVNTNFTAEAVATNAAEKVLVAGRIGNSAVIDVRNADGTPDLTFNKTGQVVSVTENAYYAVVAQGDKIVVAGTVNGDFVLVRYNADGRLDLSFGSGGRVVVDFGMPNDAAYALALAPDGKLVAAGVSDGNLAFARFGPDGALDPTFAQGGKQMFDLGGMDLAGSVVVQPDGKVVAAGTSVTDAGAAQVAVIRLGANGEADPTFSGDGLLFVAGLAGRNDPTLADRSVGLALQSDGKILVGNHTAGDNFGVARIDANGNVDSAFGSDGVATADFGGSDDVDAIIVQPTGEILAVGTSLSGGTGSTTVSAFSASGAMIEAFGTGGMLTIDSGVLPASRELHVGDLVLRAFGARQANGRVVVGTTNNAPQQASQSALRRLNVPGTRSVAAGTQIGTFGAVNGRTQKLVYTDADGTKITFVIKGGTGTAFLGADNRINLVLTDDGGGGATVSVKGKGGDGRITFGDVTANGAVRSMSVKNGDLAGMFCAAGGIGKLTLGNVTGSICSAGGIGSLTAAALNGAKVLAGTNLGADGEFGGTGADADAFGAGEIGRLKVAGQIVGSTVGAGLDPVDATYLDEDDRVIGGAASVIRSITARGADDSSRFLAGAFGKVKLGAKVTPATDARFRVLA